MSQAKRTTPAIHFLSRRAREELSALQFNVQTLGSQRTAALYIFLASRRAATAIAQHDYWLEFTWVDQEYRVAVRRLAQFCSEHRNGSRSAPRLSSSAAVR